MKYLAFFLLTCWYLALFSCRSQDNRRQSLTINDKGIMALIHEKCPDADIVEIEESKEYTEVNYFCGNTLYETGIKNGQIIFTESPADISVVPIDKINKKLEKKYQGWILDEISLVELPDTSFLKVEIIRDGIEQNVYFTTSGKFYKSKSIAVSDKWNSSKLSEIALYKNSPYDFFNTDSVFEMPDVLNELSGIAKLTNESVICIQDELGVVFEFNLISESITKMHRFTDVGDFEDIAIAGNNVFVLRSDGTLFSFDYYHNNSAVNQSILPINSLNLEGLYYDKTQNCFYVASKEHLLGGDETKRLVFKYLPGQASEIESAVVIDQLELNRLFASQFGSIYSGKVSFNPSAIAVHPVTKELYILSSIDKMLVVCKDGKILRFYPLPADIYFKPEGIAFFENGDLLIANEGDKKGLVKGNIVFLPYRN
ncbi:MAG: hypothetical protein KBB11_10585 [Bacteroidales bacterium]|nr:hypothetical protein [Bacteroidales bacterium]HOY39273.1 hypothetical protein [Bacteroidales bacterium]HQP04053.1 hypothetical protein [Bacteroidales bacterium]